MGFVFSGSANQYTINIADFNLGTSSADPTQCVGGIVGQNLNVSVSLSFPRGHIDLTVLERAQGPNGKYTAVIGDEFLKSWYSYVL